MICIRVKELGHVACVGCLKSKSESLDERPGRQIPHGRQGCRLDKSDRNRL